MELPQQQHHHYHSRSYRHGTISDQGVLKVLRYPVLLRFCCCRYVENFPGFVEPILGIDLTDKFRCGNRAEGKQTWQSWLLHAVDPAAAAGPTSRVWVLRGQVWPSSEQEQGCAGLSSQETHNGA